MTKSSPDPCVSEALQQLGVETLAFGIHQSAFPAGDADLGMGTPHSAAGRRLVSFVRELGFNTLQLGPEGQVSVDNPSPYDGTVFARNEMLLDVASLTGAEYGSLFTEQDVAALVEEAPSDVRRADAARARRRVHEALRRAQARLARRPSEDFARRALARFRDEQAAWLERDALFEVMAQRLGHDDPSRFDPGVRALFEASEDGYRRRSALRAVLGDDLERVELGQWLVRQQSGALREYAHSLGMALFADFQVGWSHRERFLFPEAFNPRFVLGAPPSRTNPEGQPWGYPLLDPEQLEDAHSPARTLLERRLRHTFECYDGVRIDHPHGLVCPWIYSASEPDTLRAVQHGTRAFESPDLDDDDLKRWAVARPEDLNTRVPRFDDAWVARVQEGQVARWSRLMDVVMAVAAAHGHGAEAIAAEVLSTCPTPLRHVLDRHGLGRFRVVQKARVDDPLDVYRSDQAKPRDWVMLGNHDTPPFWQVVTGWFRDGSAPARAAYLAARLQPQPSLRDRFQDELSQSPTALAHAHLADLFCCDARHVLVYFIDLFGDARPFNRPGVIHPDNWSLRVPPDFESVYRTRVDAGRGLDLRAALALALRARGGEETLIHALEARAS